jgi:outer membrane lipoprotein SlyB
MFATPSRSHLRRGWSPWFTVAGTAAIVSAFALTACGPRDATQTASATAAAPMSTQPSATMATTTSPAALTAADSTRATPVPQAAPPVTAAAPTAVPPATLAQAAPAQPGVDDGVPPAAMGGVAAPSRPVPAIAPRATRVAQAPAPSGRLGSVDSIEPIRERPQGTGAGAVIGGVAGAVIGNQFGHGLGRAAMTGLGVAGGAIAGNNVERNVRKRVVGYRVRVRLDDGRTRTFERSSVGDLRVGDRVRVDNNGFRRA